MEYFEANEFNNDLTRHQRFCEQLNHAARLYNQLEIGKFDKAALAIFFDRQNRVKTLTELVEAPVISDLDKLGIKNENLRKSQIEGATAQQKEIISEIEETLKITIAGYIDHEAFEIRLGEVLVSDKWTAKLRESYTTKPESDNQKRFVELCESFEKTFNELKSLLPGVDIVADGRMMQNKPLFNLQGNTIDFLHKKYLAKVKP